MKGKVDIQEFYSVLDSLYEKKEMDKAEPYMLEVLSRAGNLEDLEGVVSVCNELGGLYRAMRRTDEALWTYEKVTPSLPLGASAFFVAIISLCVFFLLVYVNFLTVALPATFGKPRKPFLDFRR